MPEIVGHSLITAFFGAIILAVFGGSFFVGRLRDLSQIHLDTHPDFKRLTLWSQAHHANFHLVLFWKRQWMWCSAPKLILEPIHNTTSFPPEALEEQALNSLPFKLHILAHLSAFCSWPFHLVNPDVHVTLAQASTTIDTQQMSRHQRMSAAHQLHHSQEAPNEPSCFAQIAEI